MTADGTSRTEEDTLHEGGEENAHGERCGEADNHWDRTPEKAASVVEENMKVNLVPSLSRLHDEGFHNRLPKNVFMGSIGPSVGSPPLNV